MPAWGWAPVADSVGINGSYMIPVETGMLCSERLKSAEPCEKGGERWNTTVKTFIGLSDMNEKNIAAWKYLRDSGCILSTPKFPNSNPDVSRAREVQMLQMRIEGKAWEGRRDYALKMIAQKKGENYCPEDGLSLF
jgi:hypothetical protein